MHTNKHEEIPQYDFLLFEIKCHFSLKASFVHVRLQNWIHTSGVHSATLGIITRRWPRIIAVHEAAIKRPLS